MATGDIVEFVRASEVTHGVEGDDDNATLSFVCKFSQASGDAPPDNGDELIRDYIENNLGTGVNQIPGVWDEMPKGKTRIRQLSPYYYKCDVRYAFVTPPVIRDEREGEGLGTVSLRFRSATQTFTARVANDQRSYDVNGEIDDPPHGNAINVVQTKDSTEARGAQAFRRVQEFEIQYTRQSVFFSDEYCASVSELVSKVNAATYRGHARGEVTFMGIDGTVESNGSSTLTYRFAIEKNKPAGTVIDGITVVDAMDGWEKVWVERQEEVDEENKVIEAKPKTVHVYRDFEYGDFSILP
tara:strand:- start:175 stop:1068 length:894 start_codon:yes stop_codon:yes gene_type:complete